MKIFQIGFNKCGTTSIDIFLKKSGFKTIHWDYGNLAKVIKFNIESSLPPLNGYERYQCFSDMEFLCEKFHISIYTDYFQEIDEFYSDAVFILNTRPVDKWLKSRLLHNNGTYLNRFKKLLKASSEDVEKYWLHSWEQHLINTKKYFEGRDNFLEFNIETDSGLKLCEFLNLDSKYAKNYGHHHSTAFRS